MHNLNKLRLFLRISHLCKAFWFKGGGGGAWSEHKKGVLIVWFGFLVVFVLLLVATNFC